MPTTETLGNLQKEAIKVVQEFVAAINASSNNGEILEHLHCLLNEENENVTYDYQLTCLETLSMLAEEKLHSKIYKKLGRWHYANLVLMLKKMHSFCASMDSENHIAEMLVFELDQYGATPEVYSVIINEYRTKIKGVRLPSPD